MGKNCAQLVYTTLDKSVVRGAQLVHYPATQPDKSGDSVHNANDTPLSLHISTTPLSTYFSRRLSLLYALLPTLSTSPITTTTI